LTSRDRASDSRCDGRDPPYCRYASRLLASLRRLIPYFRRNGSGGLGENANPTGVSVVAVHPLAFTHCTYGNSVRFALKCDIPVVRSTEQLGSPYEPPWKLNTITAIANLDRFGFTLFMSRYTQKLVHTK
jgi:hypothetical protein